MYKNKQYYNYILFYTNLRNMSIKLIKYKLNYIKILDVFEETYLKT